MYDYTTVVDDTLQLYRGAGFFKSFTLLRSDNTTPIDITGATGVCKFRAAFADAVLFTGTVALVTPASGIFSVTVEDADTLAATVTPSGARTWQKLYWDVLLSLGSDKYLAARGECEFYPIASY